MTKTPKADDIVRLIAYNPNWPSLQEGVDYYVTKVLQDEYLKLKDFDDGFVFHKKMFKIVGHASAKFMCVKAPVMSQLEVGQIYDAKETWRGVDCKYRIVVNRTDYSPTCFTKVRNWEEAKHALDMIHEANVENARKFTKW